MTRRLGFLVLALCSAVTATVGSGMDPVDVGASEGPGVGWPLPATTSRGLALIENRGQWPEGVRFAGCVGGMVVRAEEGALAFELRDRGDPRRGVLLRMSFENALPGVMPEGLEASEGLYNFFLGNDPAKWQRRVRAFRRVRYADLYPGIDVVLRGSGPPEYDLYVDPGADLERVVIRFEGLDALRVEGSEILRGETALGEVVQLPGRSWQELPSGGTGASFIACCYAAARCRIPCLAASRNRPRCSCRHLLPRW